MHEYRRSAYRIRALIHDSATCDLWPCGPVASLGNHSRSPRDTSVDRKHRDYLPMRSTFVLAALAALPMALSAPFAQTPRAQAFSFSTDDDDRPRLGVSTRTTGMRDTLGLMVESVTEGGPADKAGIEEGDRLQSVDGVNLRLTRDDAEDEGMGDLATRRLTRQLGKHKAGDEVEIRLYRDGQAKTVRAKLVDVDDLEPRTRTLSGLRTSLNNRSVLGVSLGGTGSRRDTLGVLVVGVTDDGPAAKAGIEEGDRIQSVNGTDLRVDREDAGDWESSSARIRRLNRVMEKVKPGDDVELRVYSQGQSRTLHAKAARAGDLRRNTGDFFFNDGGAMPGVIRALPRPIAPTPAPARPIIRIGPRVIVSGEGSTSIYSAPTPMPAIAARAATVAAFAAPAIARASTEAALASTRAGIGSLRAARERALSQGLRNRLLSSVGDGMIGVPGLRLMPVDDDLASYLGRGSERGVLVVEANDRWQGIHEGDVILSIDGHSVRERDGGTRIVFDNDNRSTIEVLRAGKHQRIVITR